MRVIAVESHDGLTPHGAVWKNQEDWWHNIMTDNSHQGSTLASGTTSELALAPTATTMQTNRGTGRADSTLYMEVARQPQCSCRIWKLPLQLLFNDLRSSLCFSRLSFSEWEKKVQSWMSPPCWSELFWSMCALGVLLEVQAPVWRSRADPRPKRPARDGALWHDFVCGYATSEWACSISSVRNNTSSWSLIGVVNDLSLYDPPPRRHLYKPGVSKPFFGEAVLLHTGLPWFPSIPWFRRSSTQPPICGCPEPFNMSWSFLWSLSWHTMHCMAWGQALVSDLREIIVWLRVTSDLACGDLAWPTISGHIVILV